MNTIIGLPIRELEKELSDAYVDDIRKAIDEIDNGKRETTNIMTLNGAVYTLEKGKLCNHGPEDVYIRVKNHPHHGDTYVPLGIFLNIIEHDLKEAYYIYHQLYSEQKKVR